MTYRPPGTLGVLRLLAGNALRRILRAVRVQQARRQVQQAAAGKAPRRSATARKRGDGLMWLMVLMLPIFLFQSVLVTGQAVGRLAAAANEPPAIHAAAATQPATTASTPDARPRRYDHPLLAKAVVWQHAGARDHFVGSSALLLLALTLVFLAGALGGATATLAGGEWTQAWLMTFPVATRSLVLARMLEYGLVTFLPWLTYCPLLWQILRALGVPGAPWLAVGATLTTALLVGALRLWIETGLRLTCTLRRLRSVQGTGSLLALVLIVPTFTVCFGQEVPQWFLAVVPAAPDWITLQPGTWPLALADGHPVVAWFAVGTTLVVIAAAVAGCTRLLRGGVMRSGGVDPGARGRLGAWRRGGRLGIVGKDLALLRRDRNFLVQTMVVPLVLIVLQIAINPGLGNAAGRNLTLLAYGIGTYVLIAGCFQVLSGEGRAIWMLYSLPVAITEVLRRKTRIWAVHGIVLGQVTLFVCVARAGIVDVTTLAVDALCVALGTWCAAHLAAGIGVLGCNPATDHVPRQMKVRHVYLYFFFAGTFVMALASPHWSARVGGILVFMTLAYAVWQRACDRLPHLLDPVVDARDSVGVYDGAAALVVFQLIQGLVLAAMLRGFEGVGAAPSSTLFVAFVIGGTVTLVVFLLFLRGRGVGIATALGMRPAAAVRPGRAMLVGGLLGGGLGVLGLSYLEAAVRHGWFDVPPIDPGGRTTLLLLAVVAAPLVEEVLFRGLLLGGLVRTVRPALAIVWSAALFTAMHPVVSWPPVFVLGVMTAWLRLRANFLPAAVLMHAIYNLVVVSCQ